MKKLIPAALLGTIGLVGVGLLGLQTASADDGVGDPNINKREDDSSELATVDEDGDNDDDSTDTSRDKSRDRSKQSRVARYQLPAQDVSRDVASRNSASRNSASRNAASNDDSRNVAPGTAASRDAASSDVSRDLVSHSAGSGDASSDDSQG